jgi:hypothetical protein
MKAMIIKRCPPPSNRWCGCFEPDRGSDWCRFSDGTGEIPGQDCPLPDVPEKPETEFPPEGGCRGKNPWHYTGDCLDFVNRLRRVK